MPERLHEGPARRSLLLCSVLSKRRDGRGVRSASPSLPRAVGGMAMGLPRLAVSRRGACGQRAALF